MVWTVTLNCSCLHALRCWVILKFLNTPTSVLARAESIITNKVKQRTTLASLYVVHLPLPAPSKPTVPTTNQYAIKEPNFITHNVTYQPYSTTLASLNVNSVEGKREAGIYI